MVHAEPGVSSFGIGGTNAHVVLEEGPAIRPPPVVAASICWCCPPKRKRRWSRRPPILPTAWRGSRTYRCLMSRGPCRSGDRRSPTDALLVAQDVPRAVQALRRPRQAPVLSAAHGGGTRPVAFLFSGQGSQHAGMGAALGDLSRSIAPRWIIVRRC